MRSYSLTHWNAHRNFRTILYGSTPTFSTSLMTGCTMLQTAAFGTRISTFTPHKFFGVGRGVSLVTYHTHHTAHVNLPCNVTVYANQFLCPYFQRASRAHHIYTTRRRANPYTFFTTNKHPNDIPIHAKDVSTTKQHNLTGPIRERFNPRMP